MDALSPPFPRKCRCCDEPDRFTPIELPQVGRSGATDRASPLASLSDHQLLTPPAATLLLGRVTQINGIMAMNITDEPQKMSFKPSMVACALSDASNSPSSF